MGRIHVCPLAHVARVARDSGARTLVSLLTPPAVAPRPATIAPENHLALSFADLTAPRDGLMPASERQMAEFLTFLARWDRTAPLLIHCYAGVSRSPAAAFIALCALTNHDERAIASKLRRLSPSATPNRHMAALADTLLSRQGRMVAALDGIGRGADCFEGEIFCMETA
ncbi:protein tyrosine phosphatase [Rhodoblastus sphagnicola]|uniref:Protein tyrosine phosphatase n=1 Tax=Rhodoblastus sphagnicola TaxID=333368 RepID=A0A2S6N4R4_9HYPH|nr:protein-tyrosine phosphatase family protein [Rhodoblastus sphagnicola]MBB4199599.1 putative protein tyrosine phosphatase [Rhodoblastus sphagnicola]PPQ29605.1 protein tyrosine phosphatase [Rhodoblastus sphagnicola]